MLSQSETNYNFFCQSKFSRWTDGHPIQSRYQHWCKNLEPKKNIKTRFEAKPSDRKLPGSVCCEKPVFCNFRCLTSFVTPKEEKGKFLWLDTINNYMKNTAYLNKNKNYIQSGQRMSLSSSFSLCPIKTLRVKLETDVRSNGPRTLRSTKLIGDCINLAKHWYKMTITW